MLDSQVTLNADNSVGTANSENFISKDTVERFGYQMISQKDQTTLPKPSLLNLQELSANLNH